MLKFQLRPSSATTANSPTPNNNNSSFSSSFSSSSACSSLSISSINSTTSSQHQRLSQISTSSRENEEIGNESPPSSNNRRPICNSPSPSLPDSPSSLPPPMPSLHLAISPPPLPPKPLKLLPRAKSSERSLSANKKEFGYLRIYTGQIKSDTDYKTLRVAQNASTSEVIRQLVVEKLRLSLRDLNLFHLFMEVRTMRRGDDGAAEVRSILELDGKACPLELERCHPEGRSRFILGMDSNAILARIYDGEICPESNYKSVFISRRTTCSQVLTMLRQMCRLDGQNDLAGRKQHSLGIEAISELRLFVQSQTGGSVECLIPGDCCLAGVYLSLLPGQKIVLRRVIVPRNDGF